VHDLGAVGVTEFPVAAVAGKLCLGGVGFVHCAGQADPVTLLPNIHGLSLDADTPQEIEGGMLSAAGWMLFSYLYSLYIRYFPRSAQLYGSLALLVILMLWGYFCMIIFLCGAEINKLLNHWIRAERKPHK
jgi:hypothetical protein